MFRTTLSRFSILGSLQSRPVEITVDPVAVEGVRGVFVAADRVAEIDTLGSVTLDAQAYLLDIPPDQVAGARRFGLSRFSALGTLQSRHVTVEGAGGTIAATRDPLAAAARHAEVDALGGYLAGRSYAVPDVSGGVSAAFEEVSGGVAVTFEEVYPI